MTHSHWIVVLLAAILGAPSLDRAGDDIVVADFEGPDYGDWQATGEAFGPRACVLSLSLTGLGSRRITQALETSRP